MKTLDDLKPSTLGEKIEDLWYDLTYYYPSKLKDFWWGCRRFCRNLKRFWGILWGDSDFDHGYLEDLLLTKLSWMSEYFKTSRIVVGEEKYYHQINLALRVGRIAFDRDSDDEMYGGRFGLDYLGYVNTQNYRRFWPSIDKLKFLEGTELSAMHRTDLRRIKARYLFYRILSQYSQSWWD